MEIDRNIGRCIRSANAIAPTNVRSCSSLPPDRSTTPRLRQPRTAGDADMTGGGQRAVGPAFYSHLISNNIH